MTQYAERYEKEGSETLEDFITDKNFIVSFCGVKLLFDFELSLVIKETKGESDFFDVAGIEFIREADPVLYKLYWHIREKIHIPNKNKPIEITAQLAQQYIDREYLQNNSKPIKNNFK